MIKNVFIITLLQIYVTGKNMISDRGVGKNMIFNVIYRPPDLTVTSIELFSTEKIYFLWLRGTNLLKWSSWSHTVYCKFCNFSLLLEFKCRSDSFVMTLMRVQLRKLGVDSPPRSCWAEQFVINLTYSFSVWNHCHRGTAVRQKQGKLANLVKIFKLPYLVEKNLNNYARGFCFYHVCKLFCQLEREEKLLLHHLRKGKLSLPAEALF